MEGNVSRLGEKESTYIFKVKHFNFYNFSLEFRTIILKV